MKSGTPQPRWWGAVLVLLLAFGGNARLAAAQGVVRSDVDSRKIGLQDQVQLTITVEGASLPDQIALPALTNLRAVAGPSVSTQMSFVNGRMSQSRSWSFALAPLAAGRAEVGPVRVPLESGVAEAPAISIDVAAGGVKPKPAPRRSDQDPFGDVFGRRRAAEPRLFVEARPSRRSLFVGEPLLLTYYLYTQTSVSGLQFAVVPQLVGFWTEDLDRPERPAGEPATVDGVSYTRFPFMLKLLFPTRAGRLSIPASTLSISIPAQSFFDAGGVVERATKPITVEVKAIPDQPGFSGAVGRFNATATMDRSTLGLGEAATLRFKIEGSGNLKWIEHAPEVNIAGARVYPPQAKSNLKSGPSGIAGSRTWEFVIVPQTAGTLEVPALAFTYFDPSTQRVVQSATAAIPLRVEGGAPGAVTTVPMTGSGATLRGGPLPLRADLELKSRSVSVLPGGAVGAVAGAVLLLHGVLWGSGQLGRHQTRAAGKLAAPRSVRNALRDLERIGREGMSKEAAAGLIEKTIHAVFGTVDSAQGERARAVQSLLEEVQSVRYAPQLGDYSERLRELALRAGEVVRRWA